MNIKKTKKKKSGKQKDETQHKEASRREDNYALGEERKEGKQAEP